MDTFSKFPSNMLEAKQTTVFTEEDSFPVRVYFYASSYPVTGKDLIIIDYLLVVIYLAKID